MPDHFTKVAQMSQTLEQLLEKRFGAQGRGLHEKISSVETKLPEIIQRKARYVATIRNKATHEDVNVAKQNYNDVKNAYDDVLNYLNGGVSFLTLLKRKLFVVAFAFLFVAIWYFMRR